MEIYEKLAEPVYNKLMAKGREKLAKMYSLTFRSTWETTLKTTEDGGVFLITGDIPAMWLRDSSAQVTHYLPFAKENDTVRDMIKKLIQRQFFYITLDPYANAYNLTANNNHWDDDDNAATKEAAPWLWERKYEIDSLCNPVNLAYRFYKLTGDTGFADGNFYSGIENILTVFETEQHHDEKSPYHFNRKNCPPTDTLPCNGKGNPVKYTGMTWSGFRPSDDACVYGYLIPSNFFAVQALKYIAEMLEAFAPSKTDFINRANKLALEISQGLKINAIVNHPEFGAVYAYEVDGFGNYHIMDDANVPSLLSLPYLSCVSKDDPVYKNTRKMLLSKENPYYFEGTCVKGIGSPHTPENYVWPISLCIQALTSNNEDEIKELICKLESIDAGTYLMHEGVDVNNPENYTRPWFAWANSLFAETVATVVDIL